MSVPPMPQATIADLGAPRCGAGKRKNPSCLLISAHLETFHQSKHFEVFENRNDRSPNVFTRQCGNPAGMGQLKEAAMRTETAIDQVRRELHRVLAHMGCLLYTSD